MYSLEETVAIVNDMGKQKVNKSLQQKLILSFIAGAIIGLSYFAYIRVQDILPSGWGPLIGASIFPVGLMIVLLAGGELLSGNMMVVGTAYVNKKISLMDLSKNWLIVSLGNLLGALFVALIFGNFSGILTPHMETATNMALGKLSPTPIQVIISAIGCNWFVGLAVWLCYGAKEGFLKFMGLWFPTMLFVLIGFQHSVANMFLLALPLFDNLISISQYVSNIGLVMIGNALGGVIFVGLLYSRASLNK